MRILALDLDPASPLRGALSRSGDVTIATAPEEAEEQRAAGPVDVLVLGPSLWARRWLATLPAEVRPAVIWAGPAADRMAAEADEWLSDAAGFTEVAARLDLASKRARRRRRAVRRGNVDPLTELPNRRGVILALLRAAARRRRQGTPLSVVLLDLDRFKRINELEGHDAGDRVLRRVGRLLRAATRQDEVCGRIGGDEFVVVLSGDASQAELVRRRVVGSLAEAGVGATAASGELGASEELRSLYRRVDAEMRARKALVRSSAPPRA